MPEVKIESGNESLLSSLYFTRTTLDIGCHGCGSEDFLDAVTVGKYPAEQQIFKIVSIEVFKPKKTEESPELAYVAGLRVTYELVNGEKVTVVHGDVSGPPAGCLEVGPDELLTGTTGRLKNVQVPELYAMQHERPRETIDRLIAFLQFVVYNRRTGLSTLQGPFGSDKLLGEAFGNYGPTLALEGSAKKNVGLTAIGFTRLVQGVPNFGILDK